MNDVVLSVEHVTKKFRIYHEKKTTVFEYVTSVFDRKKHFEELTVLNDVNISLEKGEMLGVIGPNGSGKSTLLRVMAGIYRPDKGKVVRNGVITPLLELGAGFNPEMTARDNILVYGMLLGLPRREIVQKVPSIIQFAELEKFEDIKIKNFSSGMYVRLAFSTAMQVDPDILLVDEVLAVGDESFRQKSYEAFLSFKRRKKAIVFVSHSLETVGQLCDNALFLYKGAVACFGEPRKVIDAYVSLAQSPPQ